MPTRNIVLTDDQEALVERLVGEGRYRTPDEVLGAALSRFERGEAEHAAKVQAFREAVQAGIDSAEREGVVMFSDMDALRAHLDEIGEAAIADLPPER